MRLGDLDALKEQFTEGAYTSKGVREVIDNAPTVPNEYMRGYEAAEREYKRPQGEWIANPLGNYVCNKCSWVIGKFERKFCPNCGSDMRNR